MRVIAGTHGGRRLKSIDAPELRPTTDRVRESIFNMLVSRVDLDGLRVLDLFAGTGALGIEALSRGAEECVFVEKNRKTATLLRENLVSLGLEGQGVIVTGDAGKFVASTEDQFDIVFADPPYAATYFDKLVQDIFATERLLPGGLFVLEQGAFLKVKSSDLADIVTEKSFGDTIVTIFAAKK
jgi:16S rRNA (guanine966-N2)-methyltransferase